MPTTVHLPADLLASVDDRAKELEVSRNRYIVRALERALDTETGWSPGFVEALEEARSDPSSHGILDEMRKSIAAGRTRKGAPPF